MHAPIDPADADTLDAWLYSSTHSEAERLGPVAHLFDRRGAALARATRDGAPLLAFALDLLGTGGDLERRARMLAAMLMARGADVNAPRDDEPLLLGYARFARVPALEFLIAHRADVRATDAQGWTALHWVASLPERADDPPAQHERSLAAASRLLAAGAPVDARDRNGKTPLALAAFLGHLRMAQLLDASGADIDSVDADGYSVLAACQLRVEDERPGRPRFAMDDEAAATRAVIAWLTSRGARSNRGTDDE